MRSLYAILLVMCGLLVAGCTASMDMQRRTIALSASAGGVSVENALQTKAGEDAVRAVPYEGHPSAGNPLEAALWLSYDCGKYSHAPQEPQYLPCATTMAYASQTPEDIKTGNDILMYPIKTDMNYDQVGDNVYCVGFYPADGWGDPTDAQEKTSASHVIDGSQDLMFADQMVGSYAENFGVQTFDHLLAWIKINLSTASFAAAEIWGDVESLKIVSPSSEVAVAFSGSVEEASAITYEGDPAELSLSLIPDDKGLNLTVKTFGQVFCSPPAPAQKNTDGEYDYVQVQEGDQSVALGYIVRVKTANIEVEKEIFVPLMMEDGTTPVTDAAYAVGKLFVMNLRFNDIAVIEGVCTLKQWDDQSSDIYLTGNENDL